MDNEVGIKDLSNDELLNSLEYYGCVNAFHDLWESAMGELKRRLKSKEGHWIRKVIETENDVIRISYECSECGVDQLFEEHYCPNCGAKMVD